MSDYFKEIYERANVQQLRSFLIFGEEDPNGYETMMKKAKKYEGRIKKINKETREVIDSKISDKDDREEVMNKIMEYVNETDDIHTEVGLQCGFVIAMQAAENVLKEIKDNKFRIRKE